MPHLMLVRKLVAKAIGYFRDRAGSKQFSSDKKKVIYIVIVYEAAL